MPPLWLILGSIVIIGFTLMVDQFILKRRSQVVLVEGRTVPFRRKRDTYLLMGTMGGMFMILTAIGLLIEGGPLLLVLVVPFGMWAGSSFWRAFRMAELPPPTEEEVRAAKSLGRKLWLPLGVLGIQIPFIIASRVTGGGVGIALTLVDIALGLVVMWLLFRFFLAARRMRHGDANSAAGALR